MLLVDVECKRRARIPNEAASAGSQPQNLELIAAEKSGARMPATERRLHDRLGLLEAELLAERVPEVRPQLVDMKEESRAAHAPVHEELVANQEAPEEAANVQEVGACDVEASACERVDLRHESLRELLSAAAATACLH